MNHPVVDLRLDLLVEASAVGNACNGPDDSFPRVVEVKAVQGQIQRFLKHSFSRERLFLNSDKLASASVSDQKHRPLAYFSQDVEDYAIRFLDIELDFENGYGTYLSPLLRFTVSGEIAATMVTLWTWLTNLERSFPVISSMSRSLLFSICFLKPVDSGKPSIV